jgi:hypothetical protein
MEKVGILKMLGVTETIAKTDAEDFILLCFECEILSHSKTQRRYDAVDLAKNLGLAECD